MARYNSWYMMVGNDEYELPCSPPYTRMRLLAEQYEMTTSAVSNAIKRGSRTEFGKIIKIERKIETVEDELRNKIEELEEEIDNLERNLDEGLNGIVALRDMLKADSRKWRTCHPAFIISRLDDVVNGLCGTIDYAKAIGL